MIRLVRWSTLAASVLVFVIVVTACTPQGGGSSISLKEARKAEVHWLGIEWDTREGLIGKTGPVRIAVEPNPEDELRVGFYESEVGGSGPMWRASGWMAVVMSSLLLGTDIVPYKFTIDISGQIDGPSAGALMTVTVLSLLLGDTVKSDTSITGTINPDGTIGPAGVIIQKIEGAAKAGKKLILIPLGQRYSIDLKTNLSMDAVERGRQLGVQVREVGDIYEAYEAMTGKKLPKAEGITDQSPSLPAAAFEKVKAKAKEWGSRYEQERGAFTGIEERYRQPFLDLQSQAVAANEKSDSFFGQGLIAGSYAKAQEATLLMALAAESARLRSILEAPGQQAAQRQQSARERLNSVKSMALMQIDGLIDRLKVEKATNATEALVLADAYRVLAVALGFVQMADEVIAREPRNDNERAQFLETAIRYCTIAKYAAQVTSDTLELGLRTGGAGPAPALKQLERFGKILRQAAGANLNYFEMIVLNRLARDRNVHPDTFKQGFGDMDYTSAVATFDAFSRLKDRVGSGEPLAYATLGAALTSYQFSSVLVAKYYSLDLKVDPNTNAVSVASERALIHMLDFAERRTRELISLAQKTDSNLVQPVLHFEEAKISREGGVFEKFDCLKGFWLSSIQAELMTVLAGKFKLAK